MQSLRAKTYLTVLPIVAAALLVSGYLSLMESSLALTRLANRHLAYKAEQLRDFLNSEWEVVESLGLAGKGEYRAAQEESFRSYAYSVLRSDTELVFALDGKGAALFRIGGLGGGGIEAGRGEEPPHRLGPGWFSERLFGEERVGIAFAFEPFGWTVGLSELRSAFFSDVDAILRANLLILVAALSCAILLSALFLRHLTGPLERLGAQIGRIASSGDLSLRAPLEYDDEIGELARRFNDLVGKLESRSLELAEANRAEREAHETAVQREAETLFLLGRISDYNDEKTGAHLARIGALSALFARVLGLGEAAEELILNSSPLHDIGKIAIPEAILLKPGKLSPEEFEAMQRHTLFGYELLRDSKSRFLAEGAAIAHSHHERWDGSGYPQGLAGEAIPLSARIVSIVDVFDALVSERPYKAAWSKEAALEHILEQGGRHFDPRLAELFAARFGEFAAAWDELRGSPRAAERDALY